MSRAKKNKTNSIIKTTDEYGKTHSFKLVEIIEIDNQEYGLFKYLDPALKKKQDNKANDDDELIVMKILIKDGESYFQLIEDEDEFTYVLDYIEQHEEEIEFE